jgi:hypothetical protein
MSKPMYSPVGVSLCITAGGVQQISTAGGGQTTGSTSKTQDTW